MVLGSDRSSENKEGFHGYPHLSFRGKGPSVVKENRKETGRNDV